jgi:hypothetical protein
MSFYFGDTFTGTDATQIITKWNGAGAWRLGGPQNSGGRSGGWCMVMFDSGNLFYIPHTTSTGWIIATAVKPGNVQRAFIFSFGTNDGTGYQQLLFVGLNALGGISIYGPNVSGFNPLLYSSANGIYLANTWGHLAA